MSKIERRCEKCGTKMVYQTIRVREVYRNCTFCKLELKSLVQSFGANRRRRRIVDEENGQGSNDQMQYTKSRRFAKVNDLRDDRLHLRAATLGHPFQPAKVFGENPLSLLLFKLRFWRKLICKTSFQTSQKAYGRQLTQTSFSLARDSQSLRCAVLGFRMFKLFFVYDTI